MKVFEIPTSGVEHPEPPTDEHADLLKHEFTMGLIAPPGCGKTNLICCLLYDYKKYFHYILVISPSINNDEKWKWIKKQPLLLENKPLAKFLQKVAEESDDEDDKGHCIIKKLKGTKQAPGSGKKSHDVFDPKIPEDCFMTEFKESKLEQVWAAQQEMIIFLESHGKTKHLANRVLIIFDDMVGSNLFSKSQDNFFKMMNANRRHKSSSMIMVTQAYKEIPKSIRTMWSALVLFRIDSYKELEVIFEEFPMGILDKKQWLKLLRYCTAEKHSFLYYNMQKDYGKRVFKVTNEKTELIEINQGDESEADINVAGSDADAIAEPPKKKVKRKHKKNGLIK